MALADHTNGRRPSRAARPDLYIRPPADRNQPPGKL